MAPRKDIAAFVKAVKTHFRSNGRAHLPWRERQTPYRVFVSEMMLQQTQVARVIPKFEACMERFPAWDALGKASLSDVYALWSGLGYNRRAKYLRDAARAVVAEGGELADDPDFIRALPGVGPYMYGALRTFAFGHPEPFIETNIRTAVMHHFFPANARVRDAEILAILERCMPRSGQAAKDWYAALMDYGSHLKQRGIRLNHKSAGYARQGAFEGSARQLRGAILRELSRGARSDTRLASLLSRRVIAVRTELSRLAREGLVTKTAGTYAVSE